MKTTQSVKASEIKRQWYLIDAEDLVLGRLASRIAAILRGKNKTNYTPHMDCGDYVVVINADKVVLTGSKWAKKVYHHHTGYIGGIKDIPAEAVKQAHPERVLYKAVERMLSRNKLGAAQLKKLRIYAGPEHQHAAQNPQVLDIGAQNRKNKRSV
ncbi:MAG: 50S ribosomal protein L13 [Alphaproteobacteria bacterium]|nr:50S ribosomal protein L13 [Alphaproteobacteria bacterium]